MRFSIYTLGCKVNIYESSYICEKMLSNGYIEVNFGEDADVCIINTCSVTNEADKKDKKIIKRARRENPHAIIVVMGCHVQTGNVVSDADIIIGNKDKSKIVDLIEEFKKDHKKIIRVYDLSNASFEDMKINCFPGYTRGFVKIQDGCNAFCSYCIIPYARGNVRSKNIDSVISEVENLVNNGYKEIVLTGIHTGRYGVDIGSSLEILLNKLVNIPNLYRIRLSSIEINEITDGIINLIKNNKIMAHHLHIPLQSGSDFILNKMNRKYDIKYFIDRVSYIRKEVPDISITTDLIVGFPYENDFFFNETLETLKQIKFTKIHTFPYSRRAGTSADKMDNQVDLGVKKDRVHKVIELSNEFEKEFYNKFLNHNFDIVCENRNKEVMGYTSNYIPVKLVGCNKNSNEIVKVKIISVCYNEVLGEII